MLGVSLPSENKVKQRRTAENSSFLFFGDLNQKGFPIKYFEQDSTSDDSISRDFI